MIRPCISAQLNNNLAKLLKNFFQINLNLTLFDIKLVYFVLKERLYLYHTKLAALGSIYCQNSFDSHPKQINRFSKSRYEMLQSTG